MVDKSNPIPIEPLDYVSQPRGPSERQHIKHPWRLIGPFWVGCAGACFTLFAILLVPRHRGMNDAMIAPLLAGAGGSACIASFASLMLGLTVSQKLFPSRRAAMRHIKIATLICGGLVPILMIASGGLISMANATRIPELPVLAGLAFFGTITLYPVLAALWLGWHSE